MIPLLLFKVRLSRVEGFFSRLGMESGSLWQRLTTWELDDYTDPVHKWHAMSESPINSVLLNTASTVFEVVMVCLNVFLSGRLRFLAGANLTIAILFWGMTILAPSFIFTKANAFVCGAMTTVVFTNSAALALVVNDGKINLPVWAFILGWVLSLFGGFILFAVVRRGFYHKSLRRLKRFRYIHNFSFLPLHGIMLSNLRVR